MTAIHRGLADGASLACRVSGCATYRRQRQQPTVTQADIQRLQDNVYLAERDIDAVAQPRRARAPRSCRPSSTTFATRSST